MSHLCTVWGGSKRPLQTYQKKEASLCQIIVGTGIWHAVFLWRNTQQKRSKKFYGTEAQNLLKQNIKEGKHTTLGVEWGWLECSFFANKPDRKTSRRNFTTAWMCSRPRRKGRKINQRKKLILWMNLSTMIIIEQKTMIRLMPMPMMRQPHIALPALVLQHAQALQMHIQNANLIMIGLTVRYYVWKFILIAMYHSVHSNGFTKVLHQIFLGNPRFALAGLSIDIAC